jgi:GMP synthase (glutamine-hydrolysing)
MMISKKKTIITAAGMAVGTRMGRGKNPMKILCLTHADFETPGIIEEWASTRHHSFKVERPYKGEALSEANSFDMLIIMGGPQSPLNIKGAPYLAHEIALIKTAISHNKIVLGFCLGAQLIGEALGTKTERSPEKEVGVYPITLTPEGMNDPLLQELPRSFPVIHWHNDMPGLTNDAMLLAFSEGCPRQMVRYQHNVYGFQCHLEITLDGIQTMIDAVPEDLSPSTFTQTPEELLQQNYAAINHTMLVILDRLVESPTP